MTGQPDRGAELVRAMLERRASPTPPALRDRVSTDLGRTPQTDGGRRLDRLRVPLLIAALLALVAGGGYVAGQQGLAAATVAPGAPSQSMSASASMASGQPPQSAAAPTAPGGSLPVAPTAPPTLTIGALAVVTPAGDGLRVRTEPGVADDSTRLYPLLPKGTRMLILRGPLARDNHDWYEVRVDGTPSFGWVASGGVDGAWLAPAAPGCSGRRSADEAWTLSPIDLVACYGAEPFAIQAVGVNGAAPNVCSGMHDGRGCLPEPRWLLEPQTVMVRADAAGVTASLAVAVPDSVAGLLGASSPDAPLGMMVALDHVAAQACRVVDNAGLDVITRDEAVVTCRLTFAVVAMTR